MNPHGDLFPVERQRSEMKGIRARPNSLRPAVVLALGGFASAGRAAEDGPAPESQAPADLQLFLALGLPNLPARGHIAELDRQLHPRVLLMNKEFGWSRAIDAAAWSEQELTSVELLAALARTVVEGRPETRIGLIPAAFGGHALDDWRPGSVLYKTAVQRAKIAQKDGKLVGILWYQGPTNEDPSPAADYGKRFAAMIAQLRLDLGVKFVPVIVGELKLGASGTPLASALAEVPQHVIPCFFVSTDGLLAARKTTRLDSNVLWEFNERFAQAWMDLAQP
jgi:hypothetical protein